MLLSTTVGILLRDILKCIRSLTSITTTRKNLVLFQPSKGKKKPVKIDRLTAKFTKILFAYLNFKNAYI